MIGMRTFVVIVALFAGCKKDDAQPAPAPKPVADAAPAVTATKSIEPSQDVRGLIGRMGYEATHRPKSGVTAEQVFDALDKAGVKLDARKQYLGVTAKAAYCAGGTTPDGVAVSVCEYADAAAAEAGAKYMNERFATMAKHAVRVVHGATVLSLMPRDDKPPKTTIDRATRTFTGL